MAVPFGTRNSPEMSLGSSASRMESSVRDSLSLFVAKQRVKRSKKPFDFSHDVVWWRNDRHSHKELLGDRFVDCPVTDSVFFSKQMLQ